MSRNGGKPAWHVGKVHQSPPADVHAAFSQAGGGACGAAPKATVHAQQLCTRSNCACAAKYKARRQQRPPPNVDRPGCSRGRAEGAAKTVFSMKNVKFWWTIKYTFFCFVEAPAEPAPKGSKGGRDPPGPVQQIRGLSTLLAEGGPASAETIGKPRFPLTFVVTFH